MNDGSEKTFVRALQGGEVRIIEGLVKARPEPKQGTAVSARHSAKVSLSKILLDQLGAGGARVQIRAAGDTRDLSFRDLDNYALITETKIQAPTSPVLTGQYVTKTAETAIFKYVLTGVDDSALDLAKPETSQPLRQAAQLELLDHQIRELDHEIAASDKDQEELENLDSSLDAELAESFQVQEEAESDYRELTARRRELRSEYVDIEDRIAEIDTLLARFSLLEQHYGSDQDRLAAVIEAGTLFAIEEREVCPICGAEPGSHRPAYDCDGNVEEIVEAAKAETADVQRRAAELKLTVDGLTEERAELATSRTRSLRASTGDKYHKRVQTWLFPHMPQRRGGGEGRGGDRDERHCAQHEKRRGAAARGRGRRDPENDDRDRQRQHQHRHEQASAPQGHGERRADRAEHGERRRARGEGGRDEHERLSSHAEHEAEERRDDDEGERARRPVSRALNEHDDLEWRRRGHHHVERAVVLVGLKEPVEAEQRRKQGRDPKDRRAEPREKVEVGPQREGHDGDQDQKERGADRSAAPDAPGDAPFTDEEGGGGGHGVVASLSSFAFRSPSEACVAATRRPPASRCACMTVAKADCELASSAVVGSSRSQSGRLATRRRASAARRFWPAESARAGKSTTCARPTRASAASAVARVAAPPSIAAQKTRFSPAVSAPLIASAWPR